LYGNGYLWDGLTFYLPPAPNIRLHMSAQSTTAEDHLPENQMCVHVRWWNVESITAQTSNYSATNSRMDYVPKLKKKLNSVAFSPQAKYTDRATAACWRS
jgi:hypothetical protein